MKKKHKSKKKNNFNILEFIKKYKIEIIISILLIFHLFFRFYQFDTRANFGWDQVDSAWAAKNIIVDHKVLLEGVPAKGNSGIFMGPLYYYLIAPFYFITNLDPIASPIFAGVISLFGFFVIYFVTKKMFGTNVALVALFINTFSLAAIATERTQNAIALVVPISYLIFYFLYKSVTDDSKNLIFLAAIVGLSFHVDFTSVMYPLIIILALPFLPKNMKTLKNLLISFVIFLIFMSPIIFNFVTKESSSGSAFIYFGNYYHGLHLARVFQLFSDAFLSFQKVAYFPVFKYFVFLIIPIFFFIYYRLNPNKKSLILFYIVLLWIVVPWIIMATYKGELTDSYFDFPRFIAIAIFAYLVVFVYQQKNIIFKIIPVLVLSFYSIYTIQQFIKPQYGNLLSQEYDVKVAIKEGKVIKFIDHYGPSYIYYVYKRDKVK